MTTVLPGTEAPAQPSTAPHESPCFPICPLCQAVHADNPAGESPLQQFPCLSCGSNLIVLDSGSVPEEDRTAAEASFTPPEVVDLSRRLTGLAIAVLTCLLNYALLTGMGSWLFTQITATHDPYDVDGLLLSPLILTYDGWTPLHLAAARGDLATTLALITEGEPIDRRNGKGRTALYEAAKRGHHQVVAALLQQGADPNSRSKQGFSPLFAAAERGHAETITLLLVHGADLHARSASGDSALHRAVRQGHPAAARALLERGIAVNDKSHGQTPLEIALQGQNDEVIAVVRTYGGKEFSQAKAQRERGVALQKSGQLDRALMAYADALNLDPDFSEAYYSRGTALMEKRAPDEALIAFQAAIRLDPNLFEAYRASSQVYQQRQQWDHALRLWDRFIAREPKHGRARLERAIVKRTKGDAKGFMADLQQACALGHRPAC
ncbi:MAG: hypothetical protein NBKEAIPA_00839 [Nitrospirae bacterium]|nr:hypothetical protein [Nitrospirota bacterium]MCE7966755.1 tetratricopeptide repeat protein [Nitrospira sp. NTP2]MCK6493657.1 ankyrin repeat domain-containing protein [Nitrospira sp.]MEB2338203.1 ankyrin repeat domain-containing protein [Nitrospirales bacterium]QOJ35246.1 MAG: ankyrin repeat domain-containing protein [Nitrospira sp.]